MTVKEVREAIKDLPDDAPVVIVWENGPDVGIEAYAFEPGIRNEQHILQVLVALIEPDDEDED